MSVRSALPNFANVSPAFKVRLASASAIATPFGIWTVLLGAATLGLTSQKYKWGESLSPPVVSTLCTLVLSNLGLLPLSHPIYKSVTAFLVPLAIPLLLLDGDMRRVFQQTGRLLKVFCTGTIATVIGTLVAWCIVPMKSIGSNAWKIAAALTARHIGGAVNYVAVIDATQASPDIVTAALTADNLVVAVYFVVLLLLARKVTSPVTPTASDLKRIESLDLEDTEDSAKEGFKMQDAGVAISLSAAMCTLASFISTLLPTAIGIIPTVTTIVLVMATAIPKRLRRYRKAGSALGLFLMQVFFAVAGAGGSIVTVLQRAPVLLVFSGVQLAVHLTILLTVGKFLGFHRAEVLVASNANVGGPSTAAAMAGSKSWDSLVVPALLIGVFGYAVATFVSLGLGFVVLRHL